MSFDLMENLMNQVKNPRSITIAGRKKARKTGKKVQQPFEGFSSTSFDLGMGKGMGISDFGRLPTGNGKNSRKSKQRDFGMLPVARGGLEGIFGGVRSNGNGKKKKSRNNVSDFGRLDVSGARGSLSGFGVECVNCAVEGREFGTPKRRVVREQFRSEEIRGADLSGIPAFNGRFGQIGTGFVDDVNSARGASIDFDVGVKRGEAVSPVFKTGERFGFQPQSRLEKIVDKENVEFQKRKARAEGRKFTLEREERAEKRRREAEERAEAREARRRAEERAEARERKAEAREEARRRAEEKREREAEERQEKSGFTSTTVGLGHGAFREYDIPDDDKDDDGIADRFDDDDDNDGRRFNGR